MIVREQVQERQATARYSTVEELLPSIHRVALASAWQLVFDRLESSAGSMDSGGGVGFLLEGICGKNRGQYKL
jgi:hypothetical protein